MLAESGGDGLRGKRDRAILALLIGCGLRRAELVGLGLEDFQVREEHWVIADLIGKGKHIRIQFLLGHASVQTTEHYVGCKQKLRHAVNDNLGLEDV